MKKGGDGVMLSQGMSHGFTIDKLEVNSQMLAGLQKVNLPELSQNVVVSSLKPWLLYSSGHQEL